MPMCQCKILLPRVDKGHPGLRARMAIHYSRPGGFVGRSIAYRIKYNGIYYGYIVGGSATKHLPGRNDFFDNLPLNNIVNNVFYNIKKVGGKYPVRNFTTKVVIEFIDRVCQDWIDTYGDTVYGIETLVQKPRTGELYRRAGFTVVGETKGFSCKRTGGKGTDSWGGKRVWDYSNPKPKLVLCKKVDKVFKRSTCSLFDLL